MRFRRGPGGFALAGLSLCGLGLLGLGLGRQLCAGFDRTGQLSVVMIERQREVVQDLLAMPALLVLADRFKRRWSAR